MIRMIPRLAPQLLALFVVIIGVTLSAESIVGSPVSNQDFTLVPFSNEAVTSRNLHQDDFKYIMKHLKSVTTAEDVFDPSSAMTSLIDMQENTHQPSMNRDLLKEKHMKTRCGACLHMVTTLATEALRLNLNRQELTTKTQFICEQEDLGKQLSVECSVYSSAEDFLIRAGLLGSKTPNYGEIRLHPRPTCEALELCGPLVLNLTSLEAEPVRDDQHGSAVVRFQLFSNYSSIRKPSAAWINFVKQFLYTTAQALNISAARLHLHQLPDDTFSELVIIPAVGGPSPDTLGRRFKSMLQLGSNALDVPAFLRQAVNPTVRMVVFQLVVPPSVPTKEVRHKHRKPQNVSCHALLRQTQKFCGDGFKCSDDCEKHFSNYYSNCLIFSLPSREDKQRILDQKEQFFKLCKVCTTDRVNELKRRCFGNVYSFKNVPQQCAVGCSELYVPYFDDCLSVRTGSMPAEEKAAVEKYYSMCSKCTKKREEEVLRACDPRHENRTYPEIYPSTCLYNCSQLYIPFHDECYSVAQGLNKGAASFRDRCRITQDGGIFFRLKLNKDIAKIPRLTTFKDDFRTELGGILKIPASQIEVTLLESVSTALAAGAPPTGLSANDSAALNGNMYVDSVLRVSNDSTAPSLRFIMSNLCSLVAVPSSPFYFGAILGTADSSFGVQTLVANTHNPDDQKQCVSSLKVAKEELQHAVEMGAPKERIKMLEAVVRYHQDVALNSNTTVLKYDLSEIAYYNVLTRNTSTKIHVEAAKAYWDYRRDILQGAVAEKIEMDRAYVVYLRDLVKNAPAAKQQTDYADLNYRTAVVSRAPDTTLNLLKIIATLLNHTMHGYPTEQLNIDRAYLKLYQHKQANASDAVLRADRAVIEYMQEVAHRAPIERLNAAEARVELRKAIAANASQLVINEKRALLEYEKAKLKNVTGTELDVLKQNVLKAHQALLDAENKAKAELLKKQQDADATLTATKSAEALTAAKNFNPNRTAELTAEAINTMKQSQASEDLSLSMASGLLAQTGAPIHGDLPTPKQTDSAGANPVAPPLPPTLK